MIDFYVVYSHPSDYPTTPFVVRLHTLTGNGKRRKLVATEKVWTAKTLDEVRGFIPPDKVLMQRDPDDEPQIVEWWV